MSVLKKCLMSNHHTVKKNEIDKKQKHVFGLDVYIVTIDLAIQNQNHL